MDSLRMGRLVSWLVVAGIGLVAIPAALVSRHGATAPDQSGGAGVPLTESLEGGLHGYISMDVSPPAEGFGFGVSFYSAAFPLLAAPLKSFQIGLPGTWIIPDNRNYQQPLCPPGTIARDEWHDRGPSFRDVFQTIEGGLGFWDSTKFASPTPKFRMNGTPNCYNDEIASPGWDFYKPAALRPEMMGLAQITNRLVIPPDGLTFREGLHGELFGTAWMALPLMQSDAAYHRQATGDQSWTLFLNAQNFKGPIAYYIPDTWSAIANGYPPAAGRTLDARVAIMGGGAMEVNTVPYFSNKDKHGVLFSRIPRLLFPVSAMGTTVLMQDVLLYSHQALYNSIKAWSNSGKAVSGQFDPRGAMTPPCKSEPLKFDQHNVPLTGFDVFVETAMLGRTGSCTFGLQWKDAGAGFPQYFKQDGKTMVAVPVSQVPPETGLTAQTFAPAEAGPAYTSPEGPDTVWTKPGPKSGPVSVLLTDGSRVTYRWYRFIDQPSLQHLHLSKTERARLQALIERIHANWPITRDYMVPPTSGALATLDSAIIVTPPRGMEVGFVPIVTRQEHAPPQAR